MKPYAALCRFAAAVGWNGLQMHQHVLTDETCGTCASGDIITFYCTTDPKFFLQINENPVGQAIEYHATVMLWRYGIRDIGWHSFSISAPGDEINEAARLQPLFSRCQFRDAHWRRNFKRRHPELIIPSCKRKRGGIA
jgi:hypothetical protein